MCRDFWFGMYQWKRNKGYAALIIFILAVAIGANTLIFSFIEAVMLKPLPVRNPQNLFLASKFFLGNKALATPPFRKSRREKICSHRQLPRNIGQRVAFCHSILAIGSN